VKTQAIPSRLKMVDWIDNTDLRSVTANRTYLYDIATRHALQDGQFVVFSNKAFNRSRLIMMLSRMPVLIILPTEERSKNVSLYLQVNEYLYSAFGISRKAKPTLKSVVERSRQRFERAVRRAEARKLPPPALLDW